MLKKLFISTFISITCYISTNAQFYAPAPITNKVWDATYSKIIPIDYPNFVGIGVNPKTYFHIFVPADSTGIRLSTTKIEGGRGNTTAYSDFDIAQRIPVLYNGSGGASSFPILQFNNRLLQRTATINDKFKVFGEISSNGFSAKGFYITADAKNFVPSGYGSDFYPFCVKLNDSDPNILNIGSGSNLDFKGLKINNSGAVNCSNILTVGSDIRCSNSLIVSGRTTIGSITADVSSYMLAVNGAMICTKIVAKPFGQWPDYVFAKQHRLATLAEVEQYIKTHGHLQDMPTATQVAEQGVDLGEMNRLLLQKVEELTLQLIELNKTVEQLKKKR